MKKLGIIQPGRLGDIIMCLPIAKYFKDMGYIIYWPMFDSIATMVRDVVDYVNVSCVSSNVYTCVDEANNILKLNGITETLDLAATFPGSSITNAYVEETNDGYGPESVDMFKYRKSGVPFEEKWKLQINRNYLEEDKLFNEYVKQKEYVVTSLTHSKGAVEIAFDAGDCQIIKMNNNHNIFYWLKILENAKGVICVESSVSNLIDQLNFTNKKFIVAKPGEGRTPPARRANWKSL